MKLCMIGTGYVGLVSGVCFSDLGNDVICVDKDKDKINLLQKGKVPIYEPGLSELVVKNYKNKRLNFSTNLEKSVRESDIIFICVGTPTKKKGNSADLSQIYNVAKEISTSINKFKIIVTKSTVPVTTGDEIEKILSKKNDAEIEEALSDLITEVKEMNQLKQIEFLEKKVAKNLDETSYSELIKLKSQLNRE